MTTSIREIAKLSGVSLGTVVNVLKTPDKVRPEKREKVLAVIKELNYEQPMQQIKKVTNTIGVIISNINNPLYPPVIKAIEEVLDQHGYSMILGNTEKKLDKEIKLIQMLEERDVDGAIIVSASETSNYNHIYSFREKGIPIILINRSTEDPTINQIMIDTFRGGFNAIKHLIQLGHERIAYMSGPKDDGAHNAFARRYKGYLWALEHYGIAFDEELILEKDGDQYKAGGAMAEMMIESFSREKMPTAAFIANDAMALGAIHAWNKRGLRVPEDISVVGFNNQFFSEYADPGLTTVNFPIFRAGKMAAEYILEEINGLRDEPLKEILPCELVVRGTTKEISSKRGAIHEGKSI